MKALLLEDWLQWSALVGDLMRFVPLTTNLCHPQLGPCDLEVGGAEVEVCVQLELGEWLAEIGWVLFVAGVVFHRAVGPLAHS